MGVGKQIDQYLADPVGLDVDQGQAGLDLARSASGCARLGLGAHRPHRVLDQRRDLGRTGLIVRRPASLRARSSRSLSSRTRWRQLSRMISTVSACFGVSVSRSSISSSAKPWTEVSGLRSSCEAVRTNSSFIRSSWSRWLASTLELFGHLVEGGAEGGGLGEAADLDPGAAVAGGEASGGVDQLLQRPPHRGDQAAEEEQRAGQAGDQPGGDEQRRVAGVAGDLVAQFAARRFCWATTARAGLAAGLPLGESVRAPRSRAW